MILRPLVLLVFAANAWAQDTVRTLVIPTAPYDDIVVQMDEGTLVLKPSDAPRLSGEFRYRLTAGAKSEDPAVAVEVAGRSLVVRPPRGGASGVPVNLVLNVPKTNPISVVGLSLAVTAQGLASGLDVRTSSGDVEVMDPIGSATIETSSGKINLTVRKQPQGDLHVQTDSGTINCTLDDGLSLKAMVRSGSVLSWGTGVETLQGSLERTLGHGGPLLYASSRANNVSVQLAPSTLAMADSVVFRSQSNWVYMNVIVRDQMEQNIPDLRRERFNVSDNGIPMNLGHFEATTEPFHLLLLFDVSGSIKRNATLIREAARQFVRRAQRGGEFAVATFGSSSRLVQPFTTDLDRVDKSLADLVPSGGTALYDAVRTSLLDYMKEAPGRKALVIFTDGVDNSLWGGDFGSTHSFNELLKIVSETDCLIYPIFVQPVPDTTQVTSRPNAKPTSFAELLANTVAKRPELVCGSETNPRAPTGPCPVDPYQVIAAAEKNLTQLANQTGGRLYKLRKMEDLASTYGQIGSDLNTVYTLGFQAPDARAGESHELKVTIRDLPLAIVRTRRGYLLPPDRH
jgi:VWFA-related protein